MQASSNRLYHVAFQPQFPQEFQEDNVPHSMV